MFFLVFAIVFFFVGAAILIVRAIAQAEPFMRQGMLVLALLFWHFAAFLLGKGLCSI